MDYSGETWNGFPITMIVFVSNKDNSFINSLVMHRA